MNQRVIAVFYLVMMGLARESAAMDCSKQVAKVNILRLDRDSGKNVLKDSVLDQDGLGTCYAHAAATMLKTYLPGHPDVSPIYLASRETLAEMKTENSQWIQKTEVDSKTKLEATEYRISGGYTCEAINAVKKVGICKRQDVKLDQAILNGAPAQIQEDYMSSLATWRDDFNSWIKDQTPQKKGPEFDASKKTIDQALSIIYDDLYKKAVDQCTVNYPSKLRERFKGLVLDLLDDLENLPPDRLSEINQIKQQIHSLAIVRRGAQGEVTSVELSPVIANLLSQLRTKEFILLPQSPDDVNVKAVLKDSLAAQALPWVWPLIESSFSADALKVDLEEVMKYKSVDTCMKKSIDGNYQNDSDYWKVEFGSLTQSCVSTPTLSTAVKAFSSMVALDIQAGSKLPVKDIIAIIQASEVDPIELIDSAWAGSCPVEKRIFLDPLLTCNSYHMTDLSGTRSERARSILQKVESRLDEGHAGIVSVCSDLFYRTLSKYEANTDKNCQEGAHAIAVIGQQCVNGKAQYLLQNSWGDEDTEYLSEDDRSLKFNVTGGKIWVKEEQLSAYLKAGSVMEKVK